MRTCAAVVTPPKRLRICPGGFSCIYQHKTFGRVDPLKGQVPVVFAGWLLHDRNVGKVADAQKARRSRILKPVPPSSQDLRRENADL
jgi:hypothetical protein